MDLTSATLSKAMKWAESNTKHGCRGPVARQTDYRKVQAVRGQSGGCPDLVVVLRGSAEADNWCRSPATMPWVKK